MRATSTSSSRFVFCALALVWLVTMSGCIVPKCYVDPKYRGATYQDVKSSATPTPVKLTVIGQSNGKEHKRASKLWHENVARVLKTSGVFAESPGAEAGTLHITINNVADLGAAAGKGCATGLTFGAVGSAVTDGYVMTAKYCDANGKEFAREYQHAIHTTIGNHAAPMENVTPTPMAKIPAVIAEDLILRLLVDLQKEGAVTTQ